MRSACAFPRAISCFWSDRPVRENRRCSNSCIATCARRPAIFGFWGFDLGPPTCARYSPAAAADGNRFAGLRAAAAADGLGKRGVCVSGAGGRAGARFAENFPRRWNFVGMMHPLRGAAVGTCRAASSSESPSRGRSSISQPCSSPTSRPAIWTPKPASASWTCSRRRTSAARPVVIATHDKTAVDRMRRRVVAVAGGAIVARRRRGRLRRRGGRLGQKRCAPFLFSFEKPWSICAVTD